MKVDNITIYTDGSVNDLTDSNIEDVKSIGTWAYIILNQDNMIIESASGSTYNYTIANSELKAIDMALRGIRLFMKDKQIPLDTPIKIYSDSKFSVSALNKYIATWKKNAKDGVWIKSNLEPVVNQNEFERILSLQNGLTVEYIHVSAHTGIKYNEVVDKMCTMNYKAFKEVFTNRNN